MRTLHRVELLRNINHALRSPLNSVLNSVEMLILGLDGELSPSAYESMVEIREDVVRLGNNMTAILEMITLITAPLELKSIQLAVPLQRAINALRVQPRRNEVIISVTTNIVDVEADDAALYLVFQYLINHFEQTIDQAIYVEVQQDETIVLVNIGVQGDVQPERLSSNAQFKDELSIGLLLCQQLVEQQAGHLYVNEAGEPPAFKICLPRSKSPQKLTIPAV